MPDWELNLNQMTYGKVEYSIEISDIVVRDFLLHAHPGGIGNKLDINVVERYGLAIHFAKMLLGQKEFSLAVPFGKERNVYFGHVHGLPIFTAEIVIDNSTVEFLAEGFGSFLLLKNGRPTAAAYVKGLNSGKTDKPLEIYFRKSVIPAPK